MQIVIDIDENVFTRLFDNGTEDYEIANDDLFAIAKAIRKGTPLPKGHGKLVDVGQCDRKLFYQQCGGADSLITVESAFDMLMSLPTIIEADGAESEQSEGVPWYLKIFNQDILNEYQKRMCDATPEERQKEVPYNEQGSSIHSEAYKGEK